MDAFFAKAKHYETQFDRSLSQYKCMRDAEEKLHIPKVFIALGGALILFLVAYFNIAGELFTDLIGWIYPAYASLQSIEISSRSAKRQWLTYWILFGFVQTLEYFSSGLVYWFPSFFVVKTLLVLWLALPQFRGAELVYMKLIHPWMTVKKE
ncbi:hypothetical protein LRAMOSA09215 [Lichtheimia ramosa]|uniref:Protein YOP1 n=1 Tax=Lichtheimia ramosa TaxID=688394 RepID=A0A077WI19_9FUNG|nr:hypothetical protein LRAMOSA09215 [Lichtheimia ramosa]